MTTFEAASATHASRHKTGGADVLVASDIGAARADQAWQATTHYVVGEIATQGGLIYQCVTAHTSGSSFSATNWTVIGASGLTPTPVKTANYSPVAGDFAKYDTTSGSLTGSLPTAPPDKTTVGLKMIAQGGTNTVTYSCGGSDVINKTGGSTSGTLKLANQAVVLQYQATGATWNVIGDDIPLSQLDARYLLKADSLSDVGNVAQARQNLGIQPKPFTAGLPVGVLGIDPAAPVAIKATTTGNDYNAYPGIAVCPDKSLLVAYRSATNDSPANHGSIVGRRSYDLGRTWGNEFTIYSDPGTLDSRDVTVMTLNDQSAMILTSFAENNSGFGRSFTLRSVDSGNTWSSPSSLNTALTGSDEISGPICDLGNGTLLAPFYGMNTADTFRSAGVVSSTDGGVTWGNPIIVGNGQTDSVDYTEPNLCKLQNGTILMAIRCLTDTRYHLSTSADGVTWTSPTSTLLYPIAADGRPNIYQAASGALTLCYRSSGAQLISTSWDNGSTWSSAVDLPLLAGSATQGRYSQMVEVAPNIIAIAYSMAYSSPSVSDIMFGYIFAGYGETPLGSVISEPRTRIVDLSFTTGSAFEAPPITTDLNWHTITLNANQIGGAYCGCPATSAGPFILRTDKLQKGTYTLFLQGSTGANGGTVTVSINGVTIGTWDQYSASGAFNVTTALTFTLAGSGDVTLELLVTGKNGSSTGFQSLVSRGRYIRTDAAP